MDDYSKSIWDYFVAKLNNEYGTAGLMGNLQAESGLIPYRVQGDLYPPYSSSISYTNEVDSGVVSKYNFVNNGGGYGLAQWTDPTRKQNLYNKWKGHYPSIGDLTLACDFLWDELTSSTYSNVYDVLISATSVKQASDYVLHHFEKPAEQGSEVEAERAGYGQHWYDKYSGSTPTPTISFDPRVNKDHPKRALAEDDKIAQKAPVSQQQQDPIPRSYYVGRGASDSIYWKDGGPNPYNDMGFGIPNCTAYAYGRAWEIMDHYGVGRLTGLSWNNACNWYSSTEGTVTNWEGDTLLKNGFGSAPNWSNGTPMQRGGQGAAPKLGAIMCWAYKDAQKKRSPDNGHVAVVENFWKDSNGKYVVLASNSAYNSTMFYLKLYYEKDGYHFKPGKQDIFDGFIYLPISDSPVPPTPTIEPCLYVYKNSSFTPTIPKIYHNGSWVSATPYVYVSGRGWVRCIQTV